MPYEPVRFLDRFADHPKLGPHVRKMQDAIRKWIDDLKRTGEDFTGRLRGLDVTLPGVRVKTITYTKRTAESADALRKAFNSSGRKAFLQNLASSKQTVAKLKAAGLDDVAIARIADGKVPTGWQVHHKLPLDDGGTNAFDNLVLIKNEPFHKVITNAQNSLTKGMQAGDTPVLDFPYIEGFVYPPG